MRDQEAQVLQVGITVADEHIEHEPAKEPSTCDRRAATGIGQCREIFHAALAVFEAAVQTKQLAGINHVSALPALAVWDPVKAINQVDR